METEQQKIDVVKLHSRARNIAIIQAYVASQIADREIKELFNDQLAATINVSNTKD